MLKNDDIINRTLRYRKEGYNWTSKLGLGSWRGCGVERRLYRRFSVEFVNARPLGLGGS